MPDNNTNSKKKVKNMKQNPKFSTNKGSDMNLVTSETPSTVGDVLDVPDIAAADTTTPMSDLNPTFISFYSLNSTTTPMSTEQAPAERRHETLPTVPETVPTVGTPNSNTTTTGTLIDFAFDSPNSMTTWFSFDSRATRGSGRLRRQPRFQVNQEAANKIRNGKGKRAAMKAQRSSSWGGWVVILGIVVMLLWPDSILVAMSYVKDGRTRAIEWFVRAAGYE